MHKKLIIIKIFFLIKENHQTLLLLFCIIKYVVT